MEIAYIALSGYSILLGMGLQAVYSVIRTDGSRKEGVSIDRAGEMDQAKPLRSSSSDIPKNTCPHPRKGVALRVVSSSVTCERVERYCSNCGTVLDTFIDCT